MGPLKFSFGLMAALLLSPATCLAASAFEVSVRVNAGEAPKDVTIQRDDQPQPTFLKRDQGEQVLYKGEISDTGDLPVITRLFYTLVASWQNGAEQLYLGLRNTSPKQLQLEIYREPFSAEPSYLDKIEALGNDQRSLIKKYFQSRAFHRIWRHEKQQPLHAIAIRSAKAWFDAAVSLVNRQNSYFRMDSEIEKIMNEYEELARRDPNFRKRYLLYVNTGYMKATMDQLTVSNYQIASRIPELVTSGQFEEAEKLNSSVLDRLTNEPQETQRLVEKHQGINARLLKSNAEYIGNLQKDRRM